MLKFVKKNTNTSTIVINNRTGTIVPQKAKIKRNTQKLDQLKLSGDPTNTPKTKD